MVTMKLFLVDECGDDVFCEEYRVHEQIADDDDLLYIWKCKQEAEWREEYPEATRFYWENMREFNRMVNQAVHEFFGEYYEEDEEEEE